MSSNRAWVWTGRLAALVAAVIIPACGSVGGTGGANPGIFWNSQATTGAPQGNASNTWIDPNLGVVGPIGISNIITSADDASYDGYFPAGAGGLLTSKITYILGNLHPLSTDTGSTSITSRENQLQGQINGYRQQQLGNVGAGGGGVGGGVAVGNVTGIILAGHFQGTKSARSHCKHYALFHGGFPAGANTEGDAVQTTGGQANPFGTPAPGNPNGDQGRLGKIGVIAYVPLFANSSLVVSGPLYGDAGAVFSQLLISAPGVISAVGWTNFCVGHWRGGPNTYYWNVIFLLNPTPAN